MVRKSWSAALAVFAAVGLTGTLAQAHPRMTMSAPAHNVTLRSAPTEIILGFNERVIVRFSGLDLRDAHNNKIVTGNMTLAPGGNTKVIVPIKQRMLPGTYRVAWHVVSVDTHRVSGTYTFKVSR